MTLYKRLSSADGGMPDTTNNLMTRLTPHLGNAGCVDTTVSFSKQDVEALEAHLTTQGRPHTVFVAKSDTRDGLTVWIKDTVDKTGRSRIYIASDGTTQYRSGDGYLNRQIEGLQAALLTADGSDRAVLKELRDFMALQRAYHGIKNGIKGARFFLECDTPPTAQTIDSHLKSKRLAFNLFVTQQKGDNTYTIWIREAKNKPWQTVDISPDSASHDNGDKGIEHTISILKKPLNRAASEQQWMYDLLSNYLGALRGSQIELSDA